MHVLFNLLFRLLSAVPLAYAKPISSLKWNKRFLKRTFTFVCGRKYIRIFEGHEEGEGEREKIRTLIIEKSNN